jgi:hypothetical protein
MYANGLFINYKNVAFNFMVLTVRFSVKSQETDH